MAPRNRKSKRKRIAHSAKRERSGSAPRPRPKRRKRRKPQADRRKPPPKRRKVQRKGHKKRGRVARGVIPKRQKATAPKKKSRLRRTRVRLDPRIEAAVGEINRGLSLTAAAKSLHIPPKELRKLLRQHRLLKRKGNRWVLQDNLRRRVRVISGGRERTITVVGYEPARIAGEHYSAVGRFVRSNDISELEPFEGEIVRAMDGRKYPLDTDPNELHRIAAMDMPEFHEIYEITSTT